MRTRYADSKDTTVLPPYPELVTKMTNIKVNHQTNRSASAYIQAVLQLPVRDPRYAKDQWGTKCNYFVHDFMHVMDYPVTFMLAKEYIDRWRLGEMSMLRMVLEDAITNANMGCPTVGGLREPDGHHSHVFVVLPQPATIKIHDLIIANVGVSNFYGRTLAWAIRKEDLDRVELFGAP